jgi:hypothetical protein
MISQSKVKRRKLSEQQEQSVFQEEVSNAFAALFASKPKNSTFENTMRAALPKDFDI